MRKIILVLLILLLVSVGFSRYMYFHAPTMIYPWAAPAAWYAPVHPAYYPWSYAYARPWVPYVHVVPRYTYPYPYYPTLWWGYQVPRVVVPMYRPYFWSTYFYAPWGW